HGGVAGATGSSPGLSAIIGRLQVAVLDREIMIGAPSGGGFRRSFRVDLGPGEIGTIKWFSPRHSHPREPPRRHEYAFGKGEAVQQAIVENIEMRGQLEIGLINVADGCSGAPRDQRTSPT